MMEGWNFEIEGWKDLRFFFIYACLYLSLCFLCLTYSPINCLEMHEIHLNLNSGHFKGFSR